MRVRGWLIGGVVGLGCAVVGEGPGSRSEPYALCNWYMKRDTSEAFLRAQEAFGEAAIAYEARRDEEAARGYLAAAAAFHAATLADPRLVEARTNMRIAYANAALVWLGMSRPGEARAALERALADDPAKQAWWQRAIEQLPRAPNCAFQLEPEPEPPAPVAPPATPTVTPPAGPVEVVAPAAPVEEAAPAPVVHAACGKVERGKEEYRHAFVGQTVAELDESGGEILCGKGPIWQLRFGTRCGDLASFHKVVTVEVRAGRVMRVWERQMYNDSFCGQF